MARHINQAGLDLIKQWEGCKLDAYLCDAGRPTIGVGHTLGVTLGQQITQQQADDLLREDLHKAESAVDRMVSVPLNDNQFAALVCLTFNIGTGAFANSTLRRVLNEGHYDQVTREIMRWNKVRGWVKPGLHDRRAAECKLWSS